MKIDFIDLKRQYKDVANKIGKEIIEFIAKAQFVGGEILDRFEQSFANHNGVKYCISIGSGTDALWLSLIALGIGPGDGVIVPSNTFIATVLAVVHAGATPVFVDVNPNTYNIESSKIISAITDRTKAIVPVHLYGQACDMSMVMEIADKHGLRVVEDCAQAVGATWRGQKVGTFGTGCFSFYPTKNLGGLGQGGAVLTDDEEIVDKVRSLGNVGRTKTSHTEFEYRGFNSRLDTINALFLDTILKNYLDKWTFARQKNALLYNEQLSDVDDIFTPFVAPDATHVYHLYQIKCLNKETRDSLQIFLRSKNVSTGIYYPIPCHKQKIFNRNNTSLVVSESLSDTLLALPMHPYLEEKEIIYVCNYIKEFFKGGE